jgi:hypothetical protein
LGLPIPVTTSWKPWMRRWHGSRRGSLAVARKLSAPIPRLALRPSEAAASIGVGEDYFTEHVRPELRLVRRGRKKLIPLAELERWVGENAELVLGQDK